MTVKYYSELLSPSLLIFHLKGEKKDFLRPFPLLRRIEMESIPNNILQNA